MKISYRFNNNDAGYSINQTIRLESEEENNSIIKFFDVYTKQQKNNKKLFSVWLTTLKKISGTVNNKRLLDRNTFILLY